jgi:hypothetical protein
VPRRIAKTVLPVEGLFRFDVVVRREGDGGLRVAVPAAIVRGLVHVGWAGRWLDVKLDDEHFKAAVRPHPTSVMFALPKRHRGGVQAGDRVVLEIQKANGPRAPKARRVRGEWRPATATLSLPWLRS